MRRLATIAAVASVFAAAAPNTVLAASAPAGATGMALDARVELAWKPVPTAGGYVVYRGTSPSAITDLLTPGGIITTSYTDATAANGTTYYYAVRSLEVGMESPNSATVRVTPKARGCSTGNAIRLENCFPGDLSWKLTHPATFGGIDGFTTANSVHKGESIDVRIDVDGATAATPIRVEVYRTGFYNDVQARLFSVISGVSGAAQPACTTDDTVGLYDCSNWSVSATITTTSSWPSGIYLLKIVREDSGADNHVLMIVRDDGGNSQILYGAAVATYQAYNNYGGRSLYDFNSNGAVTVAGTPRAVKVSFDRPYSQARGGDQNWFTTSEHQMVSWLEEQGYDVSYQANTDLERNGAHVQSHGLYVLPAHDEYYSANMRAALEQARDAGKHLLSVGSNQVYWKVRFENGPGGGQDRILVNYKSTESGGADPSGIPTGTWRDSAGANRPENALLGSMYVGSNTTTSFPLVVSEAQGKDQIYRGTALAAQPAGGSTSVGLGLIGWEWDARVANGFEPAGVTTLAASPVNGNLVENNGASTAPGSTTAEVVRYQAPSGAIVLNTGTNQWAHGLTRTVYGPGEPDLRIQQTTMNILADMGATPQTPAIDLQVIPTPASAGGGVVGSTAPAPTVTEKIPAPGATGVATTAQVRALFSTDVNASTITSSSFTLTAEGSTTPVSATISYDPVSRTATLAPTAPLAIGTTYTASLSSSILSSAGGALAATSWSFTIFSFPRTFFAPTSQPSNQENPTRDSRTGAGPWSYELGMKFTVDQPTQLDAVRFWKTPSERGVHTGKIWNAAGTMLAQAEFALETSAGWQHQPLATPITLQPGQTYVASVNANDFFAYTSGGLASQIVSGPLLTVVGANGVYGEAAGVFPTQSFNNSNYFVDVRGVADGTPVAPSVTAVSPRSLAAGVAASAPVTATFSTAMDATSISASTFTLAPAGGAPVAASVTYDAANRTATLTPSTSLASGTTYTAALAGTIRDASGRTVEGGATWTFTTTRSCVCTLFSPLSQPAIVDNSAQDNRVGPGPFTREFGVRITVSQATKLTAFRFWKTPAERGTHIGKLWANGALVAQAQYLTESASGWQHQALATPVQLMPGITYTVSVNANQYYALTPGGLASEIVSGPLLTAIADNGVFSEQAGLLPTQSFSGSNYFVDLQVADDAMAPPVAPTDVNPRGGQAQVPLSSSVHVTFSRDLDVTTIDATSFTLTRQGDVSPVPATVGYQVTSRTATLTTTAPLLESATYTANLAATIRATDGTPMATAVSWTFATVDATAPETTITASPPNPSTSTAASFSFTASEAGATFECALDSPTFTTCTSAASYSALVDGSHTFQVRATDAAGNVDLTPASFTWTVDATAPETAVASGPSSSSPSTTATFTFTSSEPTGASFRCALDNAAFVPCLSGVVYHGLAEGPHTFHVAATDAAGNADATPATHTWQINLAPPETTISNGPTSPTRETSATFAFSSSTPGGTFECSLDGAVATSCATPHTYAGPLVAGTHTFSVTAIDAGGRADPTPATFTWTIDLEGPTITITDKPASLTNQTSASFGWTTGEPGTTSECRLDGAAFGPCASPQAYTAVPSGTHTLDLRSSDALGNVGPIASYSWTIDTTAPETTITAGPRSPTSSSSASFSFSSSETGSTFECALDAAPFSACASPQSYLGPLGDGSHTFQVRAIDGAGNTGAAASHTWTVDTAAPETTITSQPPNPSSATSASFSFSSETGAMFECKLDSGLYEACSSPTAYTGLTDGSHSFQVKAADAAGNVSTVAGYTWTIDTTAPTVTITAPSAGATVSASVSVTADAADSVGVDGVQFRLDGANLGAEDTAAPYGITWDTTTTTNASHTLTAVARDAVGNTTTAAVLTVTVANCTKQSGLVAAYSFDEGGGATVGDCSGLGNAGAISGASWSSAGKFGSALSFDGVDDWVTVADASSLDLTGGMTLEAWVKPSVTKDWPTVIQKELAPQLAYSLYANSNGGLGNRPSMHVWINGGDRNLRGGSTLPVGAWSHLAATYDGSAIRLYVNGAQVASQLQTGSITASTAPLRIGGNSIWPNEFFKGLIDEVRIYNRGLTAAEIQTDMASAIGGGSPAAPPPAPSPAPPPVPPSGLVAAFSFNEGTGATLGDASGLGNAGAISGASWSFAGKFDGALSFDGVDDWVTVVDADSLDLTTGMTLEAWVKPSVTKNWPTVIQKERAPNLAFALYANGDPVFGNRPNLHLWIDGQKREVRGDSTLATGVWAHLAATYDGSVSRLYVNGVEVANEQRPGTIATSTGPLRIGGNSVWPNEFFSGLIDEVRIYNRALTAAEIERDLASPIP